MLKLQYTADRKGIVMCFKSNNRALEKIIFPLEIFKLSVILQV